MTIVTSGSCVGLIKEPDALEAVKQGEIVIRSLSENRHSQASSWEGDYLEVDLHFVCKRERLQDPLIQSILDMVKKIWEPEYVL